MAFCKFRMSLSCYVEWTGVGGGEAAAEPVLVVQAGEKVLTGTWSWGAWGMVLKRGLGGIQVRCRAAIPCLCPPLPHHQWGPGLAPGWFGVTWEVRCRLAGKVALSP